VGGNGVVAIRGQHLPDRGQVTSDTSAVIVWLFP
jgi:hypothetical protein